VKRPRSEPTLSASGRDSIFLRSLPRELHGKILGHTDEACLARVSSVCRYLHGLTPEVQLPSLSWDEEAAGQQRETCMEMINDLEDGFHHRWRADGASSSHPPDSEFQLQLGRLVSKLGSSLRQLKLPFHAGSSEAVLEALLGSRRWQHVLVRSHEGEQFPSDFLPRLQEALQKRRVRRYLSLDAQACAGDFILRLKPHTDPGSALQLKELLAEDLEDYDSLPDLERVLASDNQLENLEISMEAKKLARLLATGSPNLRKLRLADVDDAGDAQDYPELAAAISGKSALDTLVLRLDPDGSPNFRLAPLLDCGLRRLQVANFRLDDRQLEGCERALAQARMLEALYLLGRCQFDGEALELVLGLAANRSLRTLYIAYWDDMHSRSGWTLLQAIGCNTSLREVSLGCAAGSSLAQEQMPQLQMLRAMRPDLALSTFEWPGRRADFSQLF
jgi:hypothetical protein